MEANEVRRKLALCRSMRELCRGGAVASWLVRSSPDRVVQVRVLAGYLVLWLWVRHFTLTVPLSTRVTNGYRQI